MHTERVNEVSLNTQVCSNFETKRIVKCCIGDTDNKEFQVTFQQAIGQNMDMNYAVIQKK